MSGNTIISIGSGLTGGILTIIQTENFFQSCLYSAIFAAIGYLTKLGIDYIRKRVFNNKSNHEDGN